MIRLIATDMDGTLLSEHNIIHPENLAAVREAMSRGVLFAVASGRYVESCARVLRAHGLAGIPIIGTNGCQIARADGAIEETHRLGAEAAAETVRTLSDLGVPFCVCAEHANVYATGDLLARCEPSGVEEAFEPSLLDRGMHIFTGMEAVAAALPTAMKLFAVDFDGNENVLARARAACEKIPGVAVTSSWRTNIEIMPAGIDKGTALRRLAARLGVGREEVMAFGDNENDLPMLQWAGTGIAMGNATRTVLDAVPLQTDDCKSGGVARMIREMVLAEWGKRFTFSQNRV